MLRLEDATKPLPGATTPCGLCARRVHKTIFHTNKVIHIYVRPDGTIENESVSIGVLGRLRELNLIGPGPDQFSVLGELTAPPPIVLAPSQVSMRIRPNDPGELNVLAS